MLEYTRKTLEQLLSDGAFGSYALLVRYGSDKFVLTSPDVNRDTCFEVASLTKVTVTAPLARMAVAEGSFGHCGYTGTSMFFDRSKELYVALLTNTARFAYREEASHEHVRGRCLKVRSSVHAAIKKDLDI